MKSLLIIMKLAILVFLAPDVRSGEVIQSEMRPYDQVLTEFKERVGSGDLPESAARKGLTTMQIWTRNGSVKNHRFPVPGTRPEPEPVSEVTQNTETPSAYDDLKGDELRECIRQRNDDWKDEFHIKPVPSKNADMIAALIACDTKVAEAIEADPEFTPIAISEAEPTPSPEVSDGSNPNPDTTPSPETNESESNDTASEISENPDSPESGESTNPPESEDTSDTELNLDDENGENAPLDSDSTDEE